MTDQQETTIITGAVDASSDAVIDEALAVIDSALARMMRRELVSSGEVADLLLDVRSLLTSEHATPVVPGVAVVADAD
jgi:hypothetical protein